MKTGIAKKLITTYLIIIAATIISGGFCIYVLNINQRTNEEMRFVTLPSLDNIKELKLLFQDMKKLTNTWVYIANTRDQDRLIQILDSKYPNYTKNLEVHTVNWEAGPELNLYREIKENNNRIIDSVKTITRLLNNSEAYANDVLVDRAAEINKVTGTLIIANDRRYTQLIETKEQNLELKQIAVGKLLRMLYFILIVTTFIVILVGIASLRYSRKKVIVPILNLKNVILNVANGDVLPIPKVEVEDEIGEMHNAIHNMIDGIIDKMVFAEQIGKGNYDTNFALLSAKDKLGNALITMRDDLKQKNETLVEQDRTLLEAQRIARVGNYYIDVKTYKFHSSQTFDEILGIDESFDKTLMNWVALIDPAYRDEIMRKGMETEVNRVRFAENYIINKYKTGEQIWVRAIGENNYDSNGNPVFVFGTLQDITASKTLELQLNNSYKIATEQNHRLLNFSYIVSHNLRMHAVNIQSLLDLIAIAKTEQEKQNFLTYLKKASDQLNETMHHLNDVVAMQNAMNVDIAPQELNKYVNHTLDLLKTTIDAKNAVIKNNVAGDVVVNYNPAYLNSVLLNFLSNAVKYSHTERQPVITIDCYKEFPEKENSSWVLQIADNGVGIDLAKNREKLFGMYKTFHGNKDAKGIGLFMAKYQVEAMGGKIEVESELNKGTTFRIFIR